MVPPSSSPSTPARTASFRGLGTVCRIGLATRGNTRIDPEGVTEAIRRGVNFFNWCGHADGLSAAVRRLGNRRDRIFIATQLGARSAVAARRELDDLLGELGTSRIDAVTYYYVERPEEWDEISGPYGAATCLREARIAGRVRTIGITSHQRRLAAAIAETGEVDFVMVRYNAAHTGAEREVFPVTRRLAMPVVAYTGLRWGALLRSTPDDPPGYRPPPAPEWYRFVLSRPDVTVALAAPDGDRELAEDLSILDDWRGLRDEEYADLRAHGERVRRHGGGFP